jgi:hypothetical protein
MRKRTAETRENKPRIEPFSDLWARACAAWSQPLLCSTGWVGQCSALRARLKKA